MPEEQRPDAPKPDVLAPYFVVEVPTEGGPGVYTDGQNKRESVRTLFAIVELNDLEKTTMWRTLGPRGLIVQNIATCFINNPGLMEAVASMMDLLTNDYERKQRGG